MKLSNKLEPLKGKLEDIIKFYDCQLFCSLALMSPHLIYSTVEESRESLKVG